ncbi:MAG: glycerol-3-phosphate dehydrogenase [Hyphomicrobiaceae bacterium]
MREISRLHDLLVIGGGINGSGIANDAAGRGLDVILCEAGDLAGATSSASSKLIHGGLRYLEHYEFRLVRKALAEREVLLAKAPHIAWPLRFILPHAPGQRPRWMIRAGLFLYDHLAHRQRLPGSGRFSLDRSSSMPMRPEFRKGFSYWDCWVDDARLVVLNARQAADLGAIILPRTRVTDIRPVDGVWQADILDVASDNTTRIAARMVINAAGPWAGDILNGIEIPRSGGKKSTPHLTLVKGSHIVVPRLHDLDDALILQTTDGRVVFVLPYEQHFSLIGTTDVACSGDLRNVSASEEEISYLLDAVARYLSVTIPRDSIVYTFAGVRPLYDENDGKSASALSRDYVIHESTFAHAAPVVSVLGGKITTYRQLAETVLEKISPHFPDIGKPWTATTPLPGGDIPDADFTRFMDDLTRRHPSLPAPLLHTIARRHGSLTDKVLGDATTTDDLGRHFSHHLYEREVRYLLANEWAMTQDDILWRRTKTGLHMAPGQQKALGAFLAEFKNTA